MARRTAEFQTIHSEGGLLPPDLLRRVIDSKQQLDGTRSEDYGLPQSERLNEVITQSWSRLRKHWAEFRKAAANLPEGEAGTGLTNDKWSLPLLRELGFGLLPTTPGPEINGRTYAINRFFGPVPIHFVGCRVDLDRRSAGVRGAAATNPHGLVQEYLNRSEAHLWAMVSNGLTFRILRDNQALSRQSYLEFDLEAMFAGELYSDFVLFWLLAHATRFAPRDANRPESCWLEEWTKIANKEGTRALGDLRVGVERALQTLGEGFTSHPRNSDLREALRGGQLSPADFHGQLLRVVYRLIFLFVAEDRKINGQSLLHASDASEAARIARDRFSAYYGTARLRELASRIKGSRHGDLWKQLQLVACALSGDSQYAAVRQNLALPALGSFLWDPNSTAAINGAELSNHDFLEALRDLAFTRQGKVLRPVDYKDLGAEELGGVYESLLALTPQISADGARFTFAEFAGNERKTSGSYYTPDSLVKCLLDSALDPVVEEAVKGKTGTEAEKAILALKVCDPAVGSGHFLVGSAHRLARHLSRVRALAQGESEPSPLMYQHALRDVIGHCLYGVDINPMAAELCRVSLWLEALEPGKPLSFLEHRIQCGNSLLGATPSLLGKGIPDEALDPIEGDDKEVCKEFKRVNRDERKQQGRLFAASTDPWQHLGNLAASMMKVDLVEDDTIEGVREKQRLYEEAVRSDDYSSGRFWADTWCAAFFWKKTRDFKYPITEEVFRRIEHNPHAVDSWMRDEIQRLAKQYQFFHWHLAFPEVFRVSGSGERHGNLQTGWSGGFDVVLGNPPWERMQVEARQFFAVRMPSLVDMKRSDREAAIETLRRSDPALFAEWEEQRRFELSTTSFIKSSRLFPLSTEKNVNSYAVFSELAFSVVGPHGRCGLVSQSGIATDDIMKPLFQFLMSSRRLVSLFDFENREKLFPGVHPQLKFCLITVSGSEQQTHRTDFVFYATSTDQLAEKDRHFYLSDVDISTLNPNTKTCPIFRSSSAASLCLALYRRVPILANEATDMANPWRASIRRMFDMSYDSHLFLGESYSYETDRRLRLYEAKLIHQFDHRYATFKAATEEDAADVVDDAEKLNPDFHCHPRYWVSIGEYERKMAESRWSKDWITAFRMITNTTNERTAIATAIPKSGIGNSCYTVTFAEESATDISCFIGNANSFCLDWLTRQKLAGSNLNVFILKQLPFLTDTQLHAAAPWSVNPVSSWLLPRVVELIYTAWDLVPYGRDCGYYHPPFQWDEERRFWLRCELDAAFFHLYLAADQCGDWLQAQTETTEEFSQLKGSFARPRHAVEYIMDTFPIVRRKDEATWGEYRTKRVILEIYDAMGQSIRTGHPYQTRLDPPPAHPTLRHPKRNIGVLAYGSLIECPGEELQSKLFMRIKTQTPFPVEYGRISRTRGGAPTLVPHPAGGTVNAELIVLEDGVSVQDAMHMLWRREVHKVGTNEHYTEGSGPNNVLVRPLADDPCVSTVLYTDFNESGKLQNPEAHDLARRAIESVRTAEEGEDGISYLMNAIAAGIKTPLTDDYKSQILEQTDSMSLEVALRKAKEQAAAAGKGSGRA